MKYSLSVLLIATISNLSAQNPIVFRVVKDSNQTEQIDIDERKKSGIWLSRLPWLNWNSSSKSYTLDVAIYPMISAEYDVSPIETAHFYNLGFDIGGDKFLMGFSGRIPTHNPVLEELGGGQLAFRALRKWNFKQIKSTRLRIIQKKVANFQAGVDYIFDTKTSKSIESVAEQSRRSYLSPFIGVFHPLHNRILVGAKYRRNYKLTQAGNNYAALSLDFSYFIDYD